MKRTRQALAIGSALAVLVLAACGSSRTADDSTTPGVTDDTIKLGMTAPLTGPAASYGDTAKAIEAYFESVNDAGGVNGRKIELVVKDDAYDPSKTVPLTERLVNEDKVLALIGGVGSATQLSIVDDMNEQKVPTLLISSAVDAFLDPFKPYVSRLLPSATEEQEILASYAKENFKDPKIGIIYQNDDAGGTMSETWKSEFGDSVVATKPYETTDTDVSNQVTALRQAGADFVVIIAAPKFTSLTLLAMERQGWDVPRFVYSAGVDPSVFQSAGAAADGLITTGALKPIGAKEPVVADALEVLETHGEGLAPSQLTFLGIANATIMVDILERAGEDLTRESLMEAHDSTSLKNGLWYGTLELTPEDHAGLQCQQILRNDAGTLTPTGEPICP